MAHEIDMSNGRANMAYAKGTQKPWHGLGFTVDSNASISEWQEAAGLKFRVVKGGVLFKDEAGTIHEAFNLNRSVLYRDDTLAALSVMSSNRYAIHQPDQILGFIADVSKATGWPVDTVGSLFGGRKIWAQLKLPEKATLPGGDEVTGHLLVATSFDGSSGTEGIFNSTRTVCANTLAMALGEKGKRAVAYHDSGFDAAKLHAALGLEAPQAWASFIETAKRLCAIKLTRDKAVSILRAVYDDTPIDSTAERLSDEDYMLENPVPRRVLGLYTGGGIGAQLASARGTGWGLVNAVTQEVDHFGSNRNTRLNSAWFGPGAARKQAVVDAVLAA